MNGWEKYLHTVRISRQCLDDLCDQCTYPDCDHKCHLEVEMSRA